jgi:hypothetical protein
MERRQETDLNNGIHDADCGLDHDSDINIGIKPDHRFGLDSDFGLNSNPDSDPDLE